MRRFGVHIVWRRITVLRYYSACLPSGYGLLCRAVGWMGRCDQGTWQGHVACTMRLNTCVGSVILKIHPCVYLVVVWSISPAFLHDHGKSPRMQLADTCNSGVCSSIFHITECLTYALRDWHVALHSTCLVKRLSNSKAIKNIHGGSHFVVPYCKCQSLRIRHEFMEQVLSGEIAFPGYRFAVAHGQITPQT